MPSSLSTPAAAPPTRNLDALFAPASVAVVGASDDSRKWGHWLAQGALRGAHLRSVHLVNHRAAAVLGHATHRRLADLPEPPELVAIAVPSPALEQAVEDALAAGARAIVAITSAQDGGDGAAALDARLAARVRAAGALLVGPNCLGVSDSGAALELATTPLPAGSIGLLSQSGNLALELGRLAAEEGLGFSRFVSLGNQADLDAAELTRALAEHAPTKLIALYVEDFRDGREFARAAAHARAAGKPIVLLAIEHAEASARAVRSHTGALASGGAAIEAACRAAGIRRVHSPQELIDVAQALLRAPRAPGRRLAVLADGGGHASVAVSLAAAADLEVPALGAALRADLRDLLPVRAAVANPVDVAGGAEQDVALFEHLARALLASGELDALLVTGYFGGYAEYGPESAREELEVAGRLGALARELGRPVIVHTMYADAPAAGALRAAGVPTYRTIEQAVRALAHIVPPRGGAGPAGAIPALPGAPATPVSAHDYVSAMELLREAGVAMVAQRTVHDADQAAAAARELAYPVVLKALGALHKSDGGGVVLGLPDEAALRHAYADLDARLHPPACSVEAMAPLADGTELLIGTRWDVRFGPIAVGAAGGLHTELLADTAVALAPVTAEQAEIMLRSLRVAALLAGARGRPPVDLAGAARALAGLSELAAAHPELAEIEVNPLLVTPAGALGLDARIVPHRQGAPP